MAKIISSKYGTKVSDAYIKKYSEAYDRHNRGFIDYKLAFWLMDDYKHTKRIGTKWYAFVGVGGSGKSTLAKNVFYFLDPTFKLNRTTTKIKDLIKIIYKLKDEPLTSIYLDEPDDDISAHSKQGKVLRKILGKLRQQQHFMGICATDLKDIPPYIFRKLDGIFFCPYAGKYMFFKNRAKKKSYVLQQIRNKYSEKGYQIFYDLIRKKEIGILRGDCTKFTPLDNEQTTYLKNKKDDLENDLKEFINERAEKKEKKIELTKRQEIILNMRKKGLSKTDISKLIGLSSQRVGQIVNEISQNYENEKLRVSSINIG